MRLLLAFLLALLACTPAAENAPRAGRSMLRVVTWNVHDLFDGVDRTTPPGDSDTVLTQVEVEAKLARVGSVLARLDADVLVLQEVENLGLLERLAAGPLAAGGYRAFLREGFDPRGIDIGVLSRVPIADCVSHLDDRAPGGARLWSRDLIEVHLDIFERPVVLLVNHLVSRLDPSEDGRRLLQAARAREVADQLRATAAWAVVLVLGDLNDLPDSAALRPLLGDGALADLGAGLPDGDAWTWSGGGARERIDYALLPREDVTLVTRVEVMSGPDITAASDHRPLLVDLWLGAPG
jgi:endonuclease/exonuclease/phosphatase family metal-dependent hydrolase